MKAFKIFVTATLLASAAYAAPSDIELPSDRPLKTELTLEVVNNYLWRGDYAYADGIPAFQPSITLGSDLFPVAASLWFSTPLRKSSEFTYIRNELQLDIYGDINVTDSFTITPGIAAYLGPWSDGFRNTEELYLIFSYELESGFGFESSFYFDVDAVEGVYFNLGPTFSKELNSYLVFESGIFFGFTKYNNAEFSMIETGVDLKASFVLSDYVSLPITVIYNYNGEISRHCYAVGTGLVITM